MRPELEVELATMTFDEETRRRLIEVVATRVIAHADELTTLDQAIGDGDHGVNMKRGFEAVLADLDGHAAKPLPEALKSVGMALVMKVGGASGPLYGTLFMTLGKELPSEPATADVTSAFAAAIEAVKARGKSDVGQKTMLDVLWPVCEALVARQDPVAAANAAAQATIPMKAVRGRASFLGDRSIGHMDPGARSSALIVAAVVDVLEGRA
jgi:phosphoenolpyruvate---glycerone phosphotransferase subunit DhaL